MAGRRTPHRCSTITAATLAAICISPHAHAQDAPGVASCRQLLETLPLVEPAARTAAAVTAPGPNACRFAPMRFVFNRFLGYAMESLSIAGLGASANITAGEPVRIEARAVRAAPAIPNPVAAYINRVGAIPFDVAVDFVSDPQAGRFTLRDASMQGESVGLVHVTAALTDVDVPAEPLVAPAPLASDPAAMGLAALSLRLDNHGFIERMVVPVVAGYLVGSSGGAQPEIETLVEAKKQQIAGMIAAMPVLYGLEPSTADALVRFVNDFPHPTGSLQCSLAADPPVHLPANSRPSPAALRTLVAAAHPTCTYAKS